MKNTRVFFLDLQTTGAKPETANILEIAYAQTEGPIESYLIEQPDQLPIPRRIQMVTGVKEEDMVNAVELTAILKKLKSSLSENDICVIHYAQFEKPFLQSAFQSLNEEVPFKIICTHEIAKRLYPNLPSRGIKALAGFFGYDSGEFKRSSCHVDATKTIWSKLSDVLSEKNIHSFESLQSWLNETPKAKKTKYEYPLAKEIRLNLPDLPGIYRMLNSEGKILYVGKATSLRSRVNSYFRGQKKRDPFKLEMLTQVVDVRVTVTPTPLHSALLETDEIKKWNPYYNIALKQNDRALVFFNRDFTSMNDQFDDLHFIGPFSSIAPLESMLILHQWLHSKESLIHPPEVIFYEELDGQLLLDGYHLFCERHQLSADLFTNFRSLLAQGLKWHRLQKNISNEEVEIDTELETEIETEVEAEVDVELTAEDIADKFERHITRAGAAYLRSRRMARMLDADVSWTDHQKSSGSLYLRDGIVSEEKTLVKISTWAGHGVETYDRLMVLLSELGKVKSKAGNVSIKTY